MVADRTHPGEGPADASGEAHGQTSARRVPPQCGSADIAAAAADLGRILMTHPLVQVVAPSGAGLTTLAHQLWETPPPGIDTVGLVSQDPRVHTTRLRETVAEELALPLEQCGILRDEMTRIVAKELAAAGLEDVARREPSRLSGGQARRLAVGVVAVQRPDLVALDCAFDGLDTAARRELARRVAGYAADGRRVVVLANAPVAELAEYAAPTLTPAWAAAAGAAEEPAHLDEETANGSVLRRYLDPGPVPVPRMHSQGQRPGLGVGDAGDAAAEPGDSADADVLRFPGILATPGPGRGRPGRMRTALRRVIGPRRRPAATTPTVGPLDLELHPGAVTWLQGPNGSGKTTVLRALAGLGPTPVDTGGVTVGLAVQEPGEQVVDATVERLVGDRGLCAPYGLDPDAHPLDLCRSDLRVAQLLAVGALHRDVFAADEPDVGLDREGRRRAFEVFAGAARRGAALLLTCHDRGFMTQVARFLPVYPVSVTARPPGHQAACAEVNTEAGERTGVKSRSTNQQ